MKRANSHYDKMGGIFLLIEQQIDKHDMLRFLCNEVISTGIKDGTYGFDVKEESAARVENCQYTVSKLGLFQYKTTA